RHPYAVDVDRQGGDLRAGIRPWRPRFRRSAGRRDPHLLSGRPLAAPRLGLRLCKLPRVPAAGGGICQVEGITMTQARNDTRRVGEGVVCLILFGLTIPAANWLIGNAGTVFVANRPCLIPVAPGWMAPWGGIMIASGLVRRDRGEGGLGVGIAVGAIFAGPALSPLIAPPALVIASAMAFLLSDSADLGVYTPLAR